MDFDAYLRFAFALVLVLALIGLAAYLARRFGLARHIGPSGPKRGRRLAIAEVLVIDAKRRLVLLRRDGAEHLVLLGPHQDLVVEAGIGSGTEDFDTLLAAEGPARPKEPGA